MEVGYSRQCYERYARVVERGLAQGAGHGVHVRSPQHQKLGQLQIAVPGDQSWLLLLLHFWAVRSVAKSACVVEGKLEEGFKEKEEKQQGIKWLVDFFLAYTVRRCAAPFRLRRWFRLPRTPL